MMQKKINRILVYGESWRAAVSYSILLALTRLGYSAIIFDYKKYFSVFRVEDNRFLKKMGFMLDQLFFKKRCAEINNGFLQCIEDFAPDLIIVVTGLHILPESLKRIKKKGILIVNWHGDEFFNPRYIMPYSKEAFALYDIHFSQRPHLFEEYQNRGAQKVEYLEHCVDPTAFYPLNSIPGNFRCDVSFIGSWSKKREHLLKKLHMFNVLIYGSSWHRASTRFRREPNIVIMNKGVYLEDFSRVVSMSKICLNMLTEENRDQTNLRNFEIPACRGFQLCERSIKLTEIFKEGEEIAFYKNEQELIDNVCYYLEHGDKRIKIAENGFKAVVQGGHIYESRCKHVLSVVESKLF